jgi:glycosyltransferase involved in cell wall biosynthesis
MDIREGISAVVPVYNSERILPKLLTRLADVLAQQTERFEVILVNDCSADGSWLVVQDWVDRHPWAVGINLMRNYGQHNAVLCGIRAARYDVIATLDDDLQTPPEEIPRLLAKLSEGFDVVYGTPEQERHGLFRNIASRATKTALRHAMGVDVAGSVSAFRAFRTDLRTAFANYCSPHVSIDVLLSWATTRFTSVTVRHEARHEGKSNYNFFGLVRHALNMLTGYSILPLRLASLIGFLLTGFGVVVLAYILIIYMIHGGAVPGFAFLASLIAVFSGAQMFALGIIGEYLARMHFRMMERPAYVIRECRGSHDG